MSIMQHTQPLSNSNSLAARNFTKPRDIATDTDELLRVQSMHSPRPSGQPQPQPPCLKVHVPTDALSQASDIEAGISQDALKVHMPTDALSQASDIAAGINQNQQTPDRASPPGASRGASPPGASRGASPPGASPEGEGRVFDLSNKRPLPFGQDGTGTPGLATSGA
eukprot:1147564-Pelagomonas_calceolata.AAC.6